MNKKYTLFPFFVFFIVFICLNIFHVGPLQSEEHNYPIFAAFIATLTSFFIFPRKMAIKKKIDVFIEGAARPIIIHMCFVILFSSIFTYISQKIGTIQAAVNICLYSTQTMYIIPNLFFITSIFSLTIGSSMGAIATMMPIALQISTATNIPLPLISGSIFCGSILGDNLSALSDTSISAVKITHSTLFDKLKLNGFIAIPAFLGTVLIFTYLNIPYTSNAPSLILPSPTIMDFFLLSPYIFVFLLTLKQEVDIIASLIFGIFTATGIGLVTGSFTASESINFIFDGFYQSKEMVHIFILVIFLSGLSKTVVYNGGFEYLLKATRKRISSPFHARIAIFFLVWIVNCAIVINTISIIVVGPIANKLGKKYKINNTEIATILDIGACISQGVLPYTPQMIMTASIAQISTLSILPYIWYQYLLLISLTCYFFYKKAQQS